MISLLLAAVVGSAEIVDDERLGELEAAVATRRLRSGGAFRGELGHVGQRRERGRDGAAVRGDEQAREAARLQAGLVGGERLLDLRGFDLRGQPLLRRPRSNFDGPSTS